LLITTVFALTASAQFIFIPEKPMKILTGTIEKHYMTFAERILKKQRTKQQHSKNKYI